MIMTDNPLEQSELFIHLWAIPPSETPDIVTIDGELGGQFIEVHVFKRSVVFISKGVKYPHIRQDNRAFIDKARKKLFDLEHIKFLLNLGRDRGYV